jgi:hypothetical protein
MPLKLLDYGISNPFGEIVGKPKNLAWPVNAYRVTLPKASDDGGSLNPFERVILKIIDSGCTREENVIVRDTCIPDDLVKCVLWRLRDKDYINEHNEINRQKRDKWATKEEKPSIFVTALLFRELATGKILPFLHGLNDNILLKNIEKEEKGINRIHWDGDHKNIPPTPRDVILALRAMKKRSMAFGHEAHMPAVQQITIGQEPEQYYLACPIAIQKNDGEFRIADPFGIGFSMVLENAFNHLLELDNNLSGWLMNWKQRLSNPIQYKQTEIHKELYHNDANQGRYPNLVSCLRLGRNRQHRSIEQIHSVLEWALFYACAQRPYKMAVDQLRLTNQSEHPDLLMEAAENIGLNAPKCGFHSVFGGDLNAFFSGKAKMETVISVALLMAENDIEHPLRRIAANHKDFINRIYEIKKTRDPKAHGRGRANIKQNQLPEDAFMREIVTSLLPAIRFSDNPVAEADKDTVADLLIDARTSIQNKFGFKIFNQLGTDLQDHLICAESFWLSCKEGDDALVFACDLYGALQRTIRQKLSGVLPPDIKDSEFLVTAQQSAKQFEFGLLPKCLCTVKPIAIRKTLQGDDQTLGACVIAFMLVSGAVTLRSIADIQPAFISDVADIIVRRGHGNEPLYLSRNDIGKLRKSTYSTIKTLSEI